MSHQADPSSSVKYTIHEEDNWIILDLLNADNYFLSDNSTKSILNLDDILNHMNTTIQEVNSIQKLSPTTVRLLLNHFNWKKVIFLKQYTDKENELILKKAGLVPKYIPDFPFNSFIRYCGICFTLRSLYSMKCSHNFCNQCLSEYITTKIVQEGMPDSKISCAAPSCEYFYEDDFIKKLLTDSTVIEKYNYFITESYIRSNRYIRWCPSPGCTKAILIRQIDSRPVKCSCGYTLCFKCGELWHGPLMNCELLKKWKLIVSGLDYKTAQWKYLNTKECPKCNVSIQKNFGCSEMICTNRGCGATFCWDCLQKYRWEKGLRIHCCSKRIKKELKLPVREEILHKDKGKLRERLLYYSDRFLHCEKTINLHKMLKEKKMNGILQSGLSEDLVQCFTKAFDMLNDCDNTLLYSIPFAFYVHDDSASKSKRNEMWIFESCQSVLKKAMERLTLLLEQDHSLSFKQVQIENLCRECEFRRKDLLIYVRNGKWKCKIKV